MMARAKIFQEKSDDDIERRTRAVIEPDDESIAEEEKQKNKVIKKACIEIDRETFIRHLLEISDIIDRQIIRNSDDVKSYDLTNGKNILQSLVYLILNPIFYGEILKIRKKLKIPQYGFPDKNSFEKWAKDYTKRHDLNYSLTEMHCNLSKKNGVKNSEGVLSNFGYAVVFNEAEWLINKYELAYKRDISKLNSILGYFIAYRLNFNEIVQKITNNFYKNRSESLVIGFDVIVKEFPISERDFYKCQWVVKLYPFCNKTEIGNIIKDFFERNLIHEKNKKSYDEQLVKVQMRRLFIERKKWERKPTLEMKEGSGIVALKFTTDFFAKPSHVISLYNEKKNEVIRMLQKKEERLKKIQEKRLSKNFSRNYSIYKLYMEGIPRDIIYDEKYGEKEIPGSESLNTTKGEIGKFQSKIRDAIKRKIVF